MQILAHRGLWYNEEERNSLSAFERAFMNGYGIETDIRDYRGKLVISHDIPNDDSIELSVVLKKYVEYDCKGWLALNVKADGLQTVLQNLIDEYGIEKYFVFDMSIPEQVVYRKKKIPHFTRQSELEQSPILYEDSLGVWMDEWEENWITKAYVEQHLQRGKMVSIISPEIHGRDPKFLLGELEGVESENLFICTDKPTIWEAKENGKN